MIEKTNTFSGAGFTYTNEGSCIASGEFKRENGVLVSASINGQFAKGDETRSFWATLNQEGNLQVNGVPPAFIVAVSTEVAKAIAEIEDLDKNEE